MDSYKYEYSETFEIPLEHAMIFDSSVEYDDVVPRHYIADARSFYSAKVNTDITPQAVRAHLCTSVVNVGNQSKIDIVALLVS